MSLQITVGAGRKNARGKLVDLSAGEPASKALARALAEIPPATEAWWSPHVWEEAWRGTERWKASVGVGIDLDYHNANGDHFAAPADAAGAMLEAARAGKIPGSVFHLTPRGVRVVFVFDRMVSDRDLMVRAAQGAAKRVEEAVKALGLLGTPGYTTDTKALLDLARLLFSPRSIVEGVKRAADVFAMRDDVFDPGDLAPPARVFELITPGSIDVADAVARYCAEHARDFPKNSGDCPVCGHKGCFGVVPKSDPPKWSCFSESHAGAGKKAGACVVGDVLDLDAWEAKRTPVEHLKATGYLKPSSPTLRPDAAPAEVAKIAGGEDFRLLKSNSYGSIVFILRTPELREKVLGRGVLEFNEMNLAITLNRRPLRDADHLRVRELCETQLGEKDGTGYKFSRRDIEDATLQVAKERPFHPVRDYLRSLTWDREPRIAHIPEDVLQIAPSPLVVSMLRKFLISAVARAEEPGCKADHVLIFAGPGGVRKSTFFRTLAGAEWFGDSTMDVGEKDSYLKLHATWIYEWAELESMQRAKSTNAVKAFITSQADRFRAPYAREMEMHPRSCVIVGTTNDREFLTDATGNRRYWPIWTPHEILIDKLGEWRDQLWAEAFAAYVDEEPWYLRHDEESDLAALNEAYMKRDAWEERVGAWLEAQKLDEVTIAGVLHGAIEKKIDQWNPYDETRVARILQSLGYEKRRVMRDGSRSYLYVKRGSLPF